MNLIDLLAIWAAQNNTDDYSDFFKDANLDARLDRQTFVDILMIRWGFAQPRFTESSAFKRLSDSWFAAHAEDFRYTLDALYAKYDPIENYNRIETRTTSDDAKGKVTSKDTGESTTDQKSAGSEEDKVSAYNETDYQPNSITNTDSETGTKTGSKSNGEQIKEDSNTHQEDASTHGNIGVTTSQQMIESEIKLRLNNIYNIIADRWSYDMTLLVF